MSTVAFALIILLHISGFLGCIEEERRGLLEIKKSFLLDNEAEEDSTMLLSWGDGKEYICCNWERVSCHPVTGRVVELDLADLRVNIYENLALNVSLFSPFNRIQFLDLSGNELSCCANYAGFEELVNLKRLRKLNLAANDFNNSIFKALGTLEPLKYLNLNTNTYFEGLPPFEGMSNFIKANLVALRDLETLDLSYNWFKGNLTAQGTESLSLLTNLKHLDLGGNLFDKHILKSISHLKALTFLSAKGNSMSGSILSNDLTSFKKLKALDLSGNDFTGSIPQNMVLPSSLLALSLGGNRLSGSLPTQGFCQHKNLEELYLGHNNFEGKLPHCFTNLSSLRVLDLSGNRFTGDISFTISNLTSLEDISIKSNDFEGKFSLSLLANHSKLEILQLMDTGKLDVETEISNWTANFQLKVLKLSNCNLNKLTGKIPTFLSNQFMLKVVHLSHNNLRGSFPNWLLQNNAGLEVLNLGNNSLVGELQIPSQLNMSTFLFDVSNNRLTGRIGEDIGGKLLGIKYLDLSTNHFEGTISSSFCNMTKMSFLDLSYNNFHGEIPVELIAGCIEIQTLKLASNEFEGEIFSTRFNLRSARDLQLNDNHFSGYVSNAITNTSSLNMLDISNNHFSGGISSWMSNMTSLFVAIIHNNVFTGRLPSELPRYVLDIAHNRLSGPLPPGFKFDMEHLGLAGNNLVGPIPDAFLNSSSLYTLDMRDNLLSGEIPKTIHPLSNLRALLLGSNNLNGSIPKQICELNNLNLIDLSNNKISGSIPCCINNISFGKYAADDRVYILDFSSWRSGPPLASDGNFLLRNLDEEHLIDWNHELVVVEFITKGRSNSYKGNILKYMSGMDLSHNNLTGEIPYEIGDLSSIRGVNLSHNYFTGSIPETFDRLSQLESLDLSYNRLSGEIPMELLTLHFLEVFSVAYNNLSGRIPDMKAQFGTFDSNSYEGNPHLCGPPLERGCVTTDGLPKTSPILEEGDEKWYEIDITHCYPTFIVSYGIFFFAVIVVFQVNPYWHTKLLNFVELCYYNIGGR